MKLSKHSTFSMSISMLDKLKNCRLLQIIELSIILIIVASISITVPLFVDDFHRSLTTDRLASSGLSSYFALAAQLTLDEYFAWTGRYFVAFANYMFLTFYDGTVLGKLFDYINGVVFATLVLYLYKLSFIGLKQNAFTKCASIPTIFLLIWFSVSSLAEAAFWKTGAMGYLWVVCSGFLMLYISVTRFVSALPGGKKFELHLSQKFILFSCVFGFYSSAGLENYSIALVVVIVLTEFYFFNVNKKFDIYNVSLVFYMLLVVLAIAASGNYVRKDIIFDQTPFLEKLKPFLLMVWDHYYAKVSMAWVVLPFFAFRRVRNDPILAVYFLLFSLATLLMIGSPGLNFIGRTTFVSDILLILIFCRQCALVFSARIWRFDLLWLVALFPALLVLLCFFYSDLVRTYVFYANLEKTEKNRENIISFAKSNGFHYLPLPAYFDGAVIAEDRTNGRLFSKDLSFDPDNWQNAHRSSYVGMKLYKIFAPEIWTLPMLNEIFGTDHGAIHDHSLYIRSKIFCDQFNSEIVVRVYPVKTMSIPRDLRSRGYEEFRFVPQLDRKIPILPPDGNFVHQGCVIKFALPKYNIDKIEFSDVQLGNGYSLIRIR